MNTHADGARTRVQDTPSGRLAGRRAGGVDRFLNIPYAEPPTGAGRFRSPRPERPWAGVREAGLAGAAPPQTVAGIVNWIYPAPERTDEDCLGINVWTPEGAGANGGGRRRPVLLWLYGGAFVTGSNGLPLADGARLAAEGDIVVVAPNYRLGMLGFAAHPALRDPLTGAQANWGLQDQARALEWVHANIEAFGGDPDRITVMGQSAGAVSACLLAQHPDTAPRFARLVLASVPHIAPPDVATAEDLAVYVEDLAAHFGTTVPGLRHLSARDLTQGEAAFFAGYEVRTRTGHGRRWPALDGSVVAAWPGARALADKPMLIGNTRTESSFTLDLYDPLQDGQLTPPLPDGKAALHAAVDRLLRQRFAGGAPRIDAAQLLAAFDPQGRAARSPGEVLIALQSDAAYRYPTWRIAQAAAAAGNGSVYYYEFAQPLAAPARGTPHNADVPFWFGTHGHPFYRPKLGAGAQVERLSLAMRTMLINFVRAGEPSGAGLPAWPALPPAPGLAAPRIMRFGANADGECASVGEMPDVERFEALAPLQTF